MPPETIVDLMEIYWPELNDSSKIIEATEVNDGSVLKRPYFYEVYPNWKEEIKRLRGQE
jgi:hypothetical protein